MKIEDAIHFSSQIAKLQTLVDGGWRLTLDLGVVTPETITALSEARQPGIILEVAAVAIKYAKQIGTNGESELEKGRKRKSCWASTKVQGPDSNT